jgi:putative oxidoreductase
MVTAIFSVHISKGFWMTNGGYELNVMYVCSAVLLAYAGFGAYSLDRAIGLSLLPSVREVTIVLLLGALAGFASLASRSRVPAT